MIYVYNKKIDDFSNEKNHFNIGRPYVLQNPYTSMPLEKTNAIYKVDTKEEAIKAYDHYFDLMYHSNLKFKKVVDLIYEKYKSGEDVYLACWCKPYRVGTEEYRKDTKISCHGDIIKEKLEKRLLKEKIEEMKNAEAK